VILSIDNYLNPSGLPPFDKEIIDKIIQTLDY